MLLEPGSCYAAVAVARCGRSRKAVVYMRKQAKKRVRRRGRAHHGQQLRALKRHCARAALAKLNHVFQGLGIVRWRARLQKLARRAGTAAASAEHLVPGWPAKCRATLGVARCNAGEITKARARPTPGTPLHAVGASCCASWQRPAFGRWLTAAKAASCASGAHRAPRRSQRQPQHLRFVQLAGQGALSGLIPLWPPGTDRHRHAPRPATSLPVMGWAGIKLPKLVTQRIACGLHDIAFGGARHP